MAAKQLIFDTEARSKVLKGVEKLCPCGQVTLGPKGTNVVLDKNGVLPPLPKTA